ncbi:MAG TPA: glycosyltransferase family 39 protein [Chitinophagaceae bacterium]|nr:glycosyltransferase family 39 protein [Chitinophagaceae bacterium]
MTDLRKHHRILFYSLWLLLGGIQAAFTELQNDEAYYWVYARFLNWGYFDHPPMVALLIRLGSFLPGELGVRLLPLLCSTGTLWLTEKLLRHRDPFLFYAIAFSLAVVQVTGFLAVPDTPLLFFTALFFYAYKKFAAAPSVLHTTGLALAMALLLYTKYHAVLIIFFTLLSHLHLLRKPQAWLAAAGAALLYVPHLWWQWEHGWISFRYHLFESNVDPYKVSYTLEYIAGQLLLAGPLAGVILLWATFRQKPADAAERALKFTAVGIFLFFFVSSFKGKVEANWTAPALVPMIVLTHAWLYGRPGPRRWLHRLLVPTLLLVALVRVAMIVDFLPVKFIWSQYHAWKGWPQELKEKTGGRPLVFYNSYQRASKYWFYTGVPSFSLNDYRKRRNNYNYWPVEDTLLGQPVYLLDYGNLPAFQDSARTRGGWIGLSYDSAFHSFGKVQFTAEQRKQQAARGQELALRLKVVVPDAVRRYLQQHPEVNPAVVIGVFRGREWRQNVNGGLRLQDLGRIQTWTIRWTPDLEPGDYVLRMAIEAEGGNFTHNSDKISLQVH